MGLKYCNNIINHTINYTKTLFLLKPQLATTIFLDCRRKFSFYEVKKTKHTDNNISKVGLISNLNFKSDADALPFYKLPIKTLIHIVKITQNDVKHGYCENRLYYLSSNIKVPTPIVSERIVKRVFIYTLSFDWLENSLRTLLDMNVSGDRILRDLWVLKYHHKTIEDRLVRVKNFGVLNLYPWMVRCSEDALNRYVEIFQETKTILGENMSTKMYLAKRLNVSPELVEDMYVKAPAIKTTRVTKLKNFLDFLISEGFSMDDIATKSRILAASQHTVEKRLEKLRSLGLSEINLNVLCRSRKDFQKYCESIDSSYKEKM